MDALGTSVDLLAYFDGPTPGERYPASAPVPTRGIAWVVRWAAAAAVLLFTVCELAAFAYTLAAEHALLRAARAGAMEATLPRATLETITKATECRLTAYPSLLAQMRMVVARNGQLITGRLGPIDGDRLSVTLSAVADSAVPSWLHTLRFWNAGGRIEICAEREMPGRFLRRQGRGN